MEKTLWLVDRADEFDVLWHEYVQPALGGKAARQFGNATRKPRTEFLDRILWPDLWATWSDGSNEPVYMCVSPKANLSGRNHEYAQGIKELGRQQFDASLSELMLFTNAMVPAAMVGHDDDGREIWEPSPKHRVWGGLPVTFTVEFDEYDRGFLAEHLAACRSASTGKQIDSRVGEIYRELSEFADFLGMTIVWSGHKSLHYHAVFDPSMAVEKFGLDPRTMRHGLIQHWERVERVVRQNLQVPEHIKGDPALKYPEAFRRLPNGRRIIKPSKDGRPHLLGIPVGTVVPQVVLWEKFRQRRSTRADTLFFEPAPFVDTTVRRRHGRGIGVPASVGDLSAEQRAHCEDRLHRWFASQCEWPRLSHLAFEAGQWVAHFAAGPDDCNPSSIMREDFPTILGYGKGAGIDAPALPMPLKAMMRYWLDQLKRCGDQDGGGAGLDDDDGDAGWIDTVNQRDLTDLERAFQEQATSYQVVPNLMRKAILGSVSSLPFCWVKGPEGSEKTRGTMAVHPRLIYSIPQDLRLDMYAFNTYDAAERKAGEFNDIHRGGRLWAVAVKSWRQEYEEVCGVLGIEEIKDAAAFSEGYDSLWACVEDKQPEAIQALSRRHAEVWAAIGNRRPVFCTQHGVLENWTSETRTRLFWHKDYFRHLDALRAGGAAAREVQDVLRQGTRLGLAVHDEIAAKQLLDARSEAEIQWVQALRQSSPEWRSAQTRPADLFAAWDRHVRICGFPRRHGQEVEIGFHTARRTAEVTDWQEVAVRNSGEYGGYQKPEFCIYAGRAGNRWYVRPQTWWSGLAHRVVVLTTEMLPTLLASRLPDVAALGHDTPATWTITELETPKLPRDAVKVAFDRFCIASRIPEVIERFRASHGEDFIAISNRADGVLNSMTHAKAKGMNGLETARIVQTMIHMGADEYEIHEVYNAWAGVDVCCRLRHVDEYCQTAGRNLGFRGRSENPQHWLIISQTLWQKIGPLLVRYARYDPQICVGQGVGLARKQTA